MSGPDRILFVYDAPKVRDGALLGEIREFAWHLEAWTVDGRDLGSFAQIPKLPALLATLCAAWPRFLGQLPRPAAAPSATSAPTNGLWKVATSTKRPTHGNTAMGA